MPLIARAAAAAGHTTRPGGASPFTRPAARSVTLAANALHAVRAVPGRVGDCGLHLDPRRGGLRHSGADHPGRPHRDRLSLRRPVRAAQCRRPRERQPTSLVAGQLLAPIGLCHRGRAGVAAIRLRPAAARAVVRCHAAELTGRVVDLEALFGATGTLRERLALAPDDRVCATLLERWIAGVVHAAPSREVAGAVAAIASSAGRIELGSVVFRTGLSLRQLERRFLADVGIPPKTYARIVRLQAALRRIAEGEALADVAIACGYYDQPHMARDFSQLAEISPAAWQRYGGHLTPLFVGR
jgi:AraC-like DNA-binding protein